MADLKSNFLKPRMASVEQTGKMLGLSIPTVYRMLERQELESVKVGRRRLIRMSSIEALTGERVA